MALSGAYAAEHAQPRAPYSGGEGAQSLQKAMQIRGRDVLAQGCFFMCAWLLQPHSLPLRGVACCFVLMNTLHRKYPPPKHRMADKGGRRTILSPQSRGLFLYNLYA